jgi:hypothetical protein
LILLTLTGIAGCAVEEAAPTGSSSVVRTSKPSLTVDEEPQQESACDPNYRARAYPSPAMSTVQAAATTARRTSRAQSPVVGSGIYDLDRDSDGVGCGA